MYEQYIYDVTQTFIYRCTKNLTAFYKHKGTCYVMCSLAQPDPSLCSACDDEH